MKKIQNLFAGIVSIVAVFSPFSVLAQWGGPGGGLQMAQSSGVPTGSIMGIIAATMNWLLAILGFIAIIGFVIAGLMYITASGDDGQIERAKEATKYSIIGIIVALSGFIVINAVNWWLGGFSSSF